MRVPLVRAARRNASPKKSGPFSSTGMVTEMTKPRLRASRALMAWYRRLMEPVSAIAAPSMSKSRWVTWYLSITLWYARVSDGALGARNLRADLGHVDVLAVAPDGRAPDAGDERGGVAVHARGADRRVEHAFGVVRHVHVRGDREDRRGRGGWCGEGERHPVRSEHRRGGRHRDLPTSSHRSLASFLAHTRARAVLPKLPQIVNNLFSLAGRYRPNRSLSIFTEDDRC